MATSMKYLSVNGKNGKTTANSIAVIAKCFAFSSVTDESLEAVSYTHLRAHET